MQVNFSWSYSKLKNFENCPKRHNEVDLLKNYTESTEQLDWGNDLHKKLAEACTGKTTLPAELSPYQKWVDAVRSGPGELLVEQKFAFNRAFEDRQFFSDPRRDVWYRGIGDAIRIFQDVGFVLDWKTGKVQKDSVQLALMAQCLFIRYPILQVVRTEFIWLAHDTTTPVTFTRSDMADLWLNLMPRVQRMEDAMRTQSYPPTPGRFCKSYCPVTSCPNHGKGFIG